MTKERAGTEKVLLQDNDELGGRAQGDQGD
jgi:hypothetical protein